MKRIPRRGLCAMLCILIFALCARCTPPPAGVVQPYDPRLPACVNAYGRAMDSLSFTHGQAPVERLFLMGEQCRDSLMFQEGLLEEMDDSTFAALERRMPGFSIFREEGVGMEPDAPYFLALSRSRGGPADTSFFAGLLSTYGEGGFVAAYVQQLSDYGGCTDFGTGEVVKAFGIWDGYSSRYPTHYVERVREETNQLTQTIVDDKCACGDSTSVIRELTLFLERFPHSGLTEGVRQRITRIQRGTDGMQYRCGFAESERDSS